MKKLTKEDIKNLLSKRFEDDVFTSLKQLPHPHELKDAQKAAQIITNAMKSNQKILVVGDYDVDGISSCAIMMRFFELLHYQNISYIIPNRFTQGYGINKTIIEQNPADVVITVDNGITAFESAKYCKENNIVLIITDHHSIKDNLPEANAIINPQQKDCKFPQKEICGATVAWYLCNAIKIEMKLEISLAFLLDFVCIATIADMMSLVKINKLLVKIGLKKFIQSEKISNKILINHLKSSNITAQDIAFFIAPLLNSAGRIGDGDIAVRFLLCDDQKEATRLYTQLNSLNQERKTITQNILELAQNNPLVSPNCVIAYGKDWHEGVLGIVATNLAKTYQRPAIVCNQKENILKGSARSFGKINLIEAFNEHCNFFDHFGGHSKAVGLEIKENNLKEFFKSIKNYQMPQIQENLIDENLGILELEDIDENLLSILDEFEPYGQGNPTPSFVCNHLKIATTKIFKSLHQQFEFEILGRKQKAISFFSENFYKQNEWVDVEFSLQRDSFSNSPLMIVKTITKCPS